MADTMAVWDEWRARGMQTTRVWISSGVAPVWVIASNVLARKLWMLISTFVDAHTS